MEPGRLLAGAFPGSPDPTEARRKLRWLLGRGIRRFVDLTEEREQDGRGSPLRPYDRLLAEEAEKARVEAEYRRFPVEDLKTPTPGQVREILALLRDGADEPAYVHCLGGKGRTGVVVACYLLSASHESGESLDAEGALAALTALRTDQGVPDPWDSPQTSLQIDFVRAWAQEG